MLAVFSGEGGADFGPFAVLRVIRLTRVVRVLKASITASMYHAERSQKQRVGDRVRGGDHIHSSYPMFTSDE